jgi:hypothetical protein
LTAHSANALRVGFLLISAKGLIDMMIITHILKSIEYFIAVGIPTIPFENWIEIPNAIVFNIAKLITIYLSIL